MQNNQSSGDDNVVSLLTETLDGIGHLVAMHIKLARVELLADARNCGRKVAIVALTIPFLLLGYAILCVGLGVCLSPTLGLGTALLLVGGVHLVGGAIALFIAARSLQDVRWMTESAHEASGSLSALRLRVPRERSGEHGESRTV